MGIFEKILEQRSRWPIPELESVAKYAAHTFLERLIGPSLTKEEVMRRANATPIQKAAIGASEIQNGIDARDHDLRELGEALVVKALHQIDSDLDGTVSPEVASAVTDIFTSVPLIGVAVNPRISSTDAERAAAILEDKSNNPVFPKP